MFHWLSKASNISRQNRFRAILLSPLLALCRLQQRFLKRDTISSFWISMAGRAFKKAISSSSDALLPSITTDGCPSCPGGKESFLVSPATSLIFSPNFLTYLAKTFHFTLLNDKKMLFVDMDVINLNHVLFQVQFFHLFL